MGSVRVVERDANGGQLGKAEDHQQNTENAQDDLIVHAIASEESQTNLKQALDFGDTPLVDQEQDDVVVVFNHQVIVCDQHLVAADDGTDGCTRWQIDLFDAAPHHLRALAVTVRDCLQRLSGTSAQGVNGGHVATTHVGQQGADGGLLGRDGDIDDTALYQIHVGRVVDQRHHRPCPQPFGQHGRHDIGLVVIGQGAENIGIFNILFHQQITVGSVAMQYNSVVQLACQQVAARQVTFYQFHLVVVFNGTGQACPDIAPAGDDDALVGAIQSTQLTHDRADIAPCRDEEHLVIGLDHGIPFRNHGVILAENGGNTGIDIGHVGAQERNLTADQRAAIVGFDRNQLRLTSGKVQHLQGAGVLNHALDMLGNQLLGADQNINRNALVTAEYGVIFLQIIMFTHSRNLGRDIEQSACDLTGNHVDLIAVGHGDQHVGILGAGLIQNRRVGCFPFHGPDIKSILQLTQAGAVGIDHGNVIGFIGKMLGQRATNLTGTEDDDLHSAFESSCLS